MAVALFCRRSHKARKNVLGAKKIAHCLIQDGYHGYATKMQNNDIEDIGLADISGLVKVAKLGGKRKPRKLRKTRKLKNS